MSDLFKYVQAPKLYLSGSGISSIATTIQVTELVKPGTTTTITMTDFGSIGYGVLESGTSHEENFSFTGITQNADGSAILTGVTRGLDFVAPYTASVSLRKPHGGGTSLVISNSAPFYDKLSGKDNDETITGAWTFTSTAQPKLDTYVAPTLDTEFATKKYADDLAIAGAPDATETVKGIVEIPTDTEAKAFAVAGSGDTSAEFALTPTNLKAIWDMMVTTDYTYGDTITAGEAVYLDTADTKWKLADASVSSTSFTAFGIALDSGIDTDTGKRVQIGGLVTGLTGLTVGYVYISDTAGALATWPGGTFRKVIGYAMSTTTMLLIPTLDITALAGSTTAWTTDLLTESMAFFDTTDITGAEAEDLTDGGETVLHKHSHKIGVDSWDPATSSDTKTITHNLGVVPKLIRLTWRSVSQDPNRMVASGEGMYDGASYATVYTYKDGVGDHFGTVNTSYILYPDAEWGATVTTNGVNSFILTSGLWSSAESIVFTWEVLA